MEVTVCDFCLLCTKSLQSCLTLCDPMDCSPPGSSVHGILQVKILEWVAMPSFRGSSWPRDWTCVSCTGRQILYHWATREARELHQVIEIDILVKKEEKWKAKRSDWSKATSKTSWANFFSFPGLKTILHGFILLSELSVLLFELVTFPKKPFLTIF